MVGSVVRHLQALGALAGAESRDAIALYLRLIIMLVAALLFLGVAYICFLFFVAFAVAMLFGVQWIWITLGLVVIHLVLAFWCASHVKAHYGTPVFPLTGAEVRKDLAQLRNADAPTPTHPPL